ncbi:MAG: hypothetical protein LC639_04190 [Idiomarina sp.]|nr:hypothetical protein [Idiomarina sp.]
MRNNFKPLGIVAAVAAATAGYANVASAVSVANNGAGDLALVPYYTVENGFITGVHVVNTSDLTQVVKFRLRRGTDSMDALDFNIVMSPKDVWAGFISKDEDGVISFKADDTTCAAPGPTADGFVMPEIFLEGASTGYIEIIGMASADSGQPISVSAKHVAGEPVDCAAVRSNFFANGTKGKAGVASKSASWQAGPDNTIVQNTYERSGNALKVSYFIRNTDRGVEFGNSAKHIQNFLDAPAMSNQEFGFLSGDLRGFDFPDLNGGSPLDTGDRGKFNMLRDGEVLGVESLINEWSANPVNGVSTDWVVTLPGQYVMLDKLRYVSSLDIPGVTVPGITETAECTIANGCDNRDLPVTAEISAYDREEGEPDTSPGELVVSPSLPGSQPRTQFTKEVNVVTFGGNGTNGVFGVSDADIDAGLAQPYGWLSLGVLSDDRDDKTLAICDFDDGETVTCDSNVQGNVPIIGFTAWERSFAANPDANYGRIIEHSFKPASTIED